MFAMIGGMATKQETQAFESALASLRQAHPELAARLGDDPNRQALLDLVAELAPAVAPGAKSMPKAALVQLIAAIAPEPEPVELVSFTTRIPADLAEEVKAAAFSRGCSVQSLVADFLRAGLEQDR
ncbi:hypothetical protein RZ63_08110 [[Haemophilus] ducreyi]|nr:hypothetical protein RZ62_08295 [[Haemophilus] ducreyi]AKO40371.1 hypothetical protein RZ63_08110 [[Haemophilus] ducreyi]